MRKLCKERKRKQSDGRSRSFFYRFIGVRGPRSLDNQGLTLIEVIVSVAIFSIVAFPLITQLNTLMRGNYTAKVSQAETDLATRVMEQFKQADPAMITDASNTQNSLFGGYAQTISSDGSLVYTKENVRIGSDIMLNATSNASGDSPIRSNTEYKVKVTLDSDYYKTDPQLFTSGDGTQAQPVYRDVNDTDYYNLQNIDDKFSILVREDAANYDTKGASDLLDKVVNSLKEKSPAQYNQWRNGVPIFNGVKFNKYLYVKISKGTSSTEAGHIGEVPYIADVKVTYVLDNSTASVLGSADASARAVTYTIIGGQKYWPSETGGKVPSVYILYNQFVQNNKIEAGRDDIIIDNSGVAGDLANDAMKVYIVRSEATNNGNYSYYERKESSAANKDAGDEIFHTQTTDFQTENTSGSYVYKIDEGNGSTVYQYPSLMVPSSDASSGITLPSGLTNYGDRIRASLVHDAAPEENPIYVSGDSFKRYGQEETSDYIKCDYYENVYSTLSPDVIFGTTMYNSGTGHGYYGYVAKPDRNGNAYFTDNNGGVSRKMYPGDLVYQKDAHLYVYPDGSTSTQPPSLDYYDMTKPSKKEFEAGKALNVTAEDNNSVTESDKLEIFTNLDAGGLRPQIRSDARTNIIVDSGAVTSASSSTLPTINTKALPTFYDLKDDKDDSGPKRIYHIKVELYRITDGGPEKRVVSLESGKEG